MNTSAKAYQLRLQARLERAAEDREYAALRARAREPFDQESHSLFDLGVSLARIEWPAAHDAMLAANVGYPPNDGHSVKAEREPSDDEIYNRHGMEGGIAYDTSHDERGSLGEHDWRL